MKIKEYKCGCGHDEFFFADKGNQTGIYCSYCGKWIKWADKNEQNLRMKQEPVLDKIKSEIDSHCSDNRDRNDGLYIAMKIIDKYKSEGSNKE